jgi:signal transduction histidine kinase
MSTVLEPSLPAAEDAAARRRWPQATLRTYLVAIILVATVPLALLMAYRIVEDNRQERRVLLANLSGTAKAAAVGVDRELLATFEALRMLGTTDTLRNADIAGFERRLWRAPMLASWNRLVWMASDGASQFEVGGEAGANSVGIDAAEREALLRAWRAVPRGDTVLVSVLDTAPARRATWLGINTTTVDGRHHLLAARVGLATWQALLQGVAPDDGAYVTLFDAQHRVLARTLEAERSAGATLAADVVAAIATAGSGVQRMRALGRTEEAYAAWQLLPQVGWGIGVGALAAPYDAQHRREAWTTFIVAAACLLLGVTAALFVARRVVRPLERLIRDNGRVVDDGPSEVTEIAQLHDAFARSQQARDEAAARLAKKAEDFETLFRMCPTGISVAQDPACASVLRNAAMLELVPGAGTSLPGDEIEVYGPTGRLAPEAQPLVRAARGGESVPPTEIEIRRPGLPPAYVLASAVPLTDAAGQPRGAIASFTDVTASKLAQRERELSMTREQQARREAESANRAKDELLAMLGHELRNPLNAIVTSAEVLRRAETDSEVAASARAIIARQTKKLAAMVDDLLDVGHVMADEITLLPQPIDFAAQVKAGAEAARATATERDQRLTLGTLAPTWVNADARRISQVLGHLLDNAVKHTPAGGVIEVELRHQAGDAVVTVRDSGPGIDAALLARIFEPFVQGERGLARSAGGLGIGLTLAKRLVELHGGSLRARSSAEGSVFELRLPVVAAPQVALAPAAVGTRIGVIDDNPDALAGMRSMLELAGHSVVTAADGTAGLAMLLEDGPGIALVDIGLPGIDGYEVARRSRAAGYRGKLIALSGYGQPHDLMRSIAEGFDAHLVKPVDPEQLLPLLRRG